MTLLEYTYIVDTIGTNMQKRKLSFWEIWNMSFGFLGIQFGFALQNANTSRIFETLGASVDDIPILWIAAPVTGLIVQPIVGYFSDRTWNRFGRRRPYFLVGAILSSIALFIMPNSPALWIAAGTLWIMDASINITMEPFRAFVGDNLSDDQKAQGFAMQSFFIGIGAVAGSLLPYVFSNVIGLENTAPEGIIPPSVKWSFYCGGIVFLIAVLWTVFKSFEYSPEELKSFEEDEDEYDTDYDLTKVTRIQQRAGAVMTIIGVVAIIALRSLALEKELYILAAGILIAGILFLLSGQMNKGKKENGFVTMMNDIIQMPKTMMDLAWVQFFSWFSLFAMWIYTTSAVTRSVFGSSDPQSAAYGEGADWVTVLFTVYNGVAALVAFLLPVIAKRIGIKATHMLALVMGGLGLASIFFIQDQYLLLISMIGVGIAWSSIVSLPYALLANALPSSKMGYYMGVFNFFIVIPQIVAATILGFMVRSISEDEPVYALLIGGISMILAGLLTLRVRVK